MVVIKPYQKPQLAGPHVVFRSSLTTEENGRLSIASAPILYGLAVYSVLSVHYNTHNDTYIIFRFVDHLKRLRDSATIVGMKIDGRQLDKTLFLDHLSGLLRSNQVKEDCLVRCTLFTDEILAGTKSHGLPTSLTMYAYTSPPLHDPEGIHVCVSSWRRTPDNCIPSRAKINGSYINASLMKNQALMEGYDDAIALDTDGHVAESTVANIFIVRNGKLITPDLSADILEGITRSTVIAWASKNGVTIEERQVDRTELYIADEIFITGTSAKITPVLSVDKRTIGNGRKGRVTEQLQADYDKLLTGALVIEPAWLTVV
jgi:branched-chain amino acid aminotransferase